MLMMYDQNNSIIVIHIVPAINSGVHLYSRVIITNITMGLEVGIIESVPRDFRLSKELYGKGTTIPTQRRGRTTISVHKDKGCLASPTFP